MCAQGDSEPDLIRHDGDACWCRGQVGRDAFLSGAYLWLVLRDEETGLAAFWRRPVHRVEGSEVLLQWGLVLDDGEWWKRDSMAMGSRPGERQSLSG